MQRGWTRQDWNGRVRDDIMWTQILYKRCPRTRIEDLVLRHGLARARWVPP